MFALFGGAFDGAVDGHEERREVTQEVRARLVHQCPRLLCPEESVTR